MIPAVETLPGTVAAVAEKNCAAEISAAPPMSLPTRAAGDSVMPDQCAFVVSAYIPYGIGGRAGGRGSAAAALDEGTAAAAFAARSGSDYARIRAALPHSLQNQFDAQLAAYGSPAAKTTDDGGAATFSQSDLAKLVQSSVSAQDDAVSSLLVARLAHDVARFGAATVAQALLLAHERTLFVPAGAAPSASIAQARVTRREDERKQQRRTPQPNSDEHDRPATVSEDRAFMIEDVVCYGGTIVATSGASYPLLNDERHAT